MVFLNCFMNLKTEDNHKNETPVDNHEESLESVEAAHEESKSVHEETEEVMNHDLKKLSLVLSAAKLSASFLLTAKEQTINSEVQSESLKAALSAAELSKHLADKLKPGPHTTSALNIALAAIAATSTAHRNQNMAH